MRHFPRLIVILCGVGAFGILRGQAPPTLRPLASGFGTAVGLALDEAGGRLYSVEFGGLISVTDIATGVRRVLGTGYTQPEDIRLAPDGVHAYVTERSGTVVRVLLSSANRTAAEVIVSGLAEPHQMAITPDGRQLFTVEYAPPGRLLRIDTVTKQVTTIISGLQQAVGLLVPANPTFALVTEQGAGGRLTRISAPLSTTPGNVPGSAVQVLTNELPSVFFLNWADATEQRVQTTQRSPVNRVIAIDLRSPATVIPVVGDVPFQPSSVAATKTGEIYISSDGVISRFGSVTARSLAPESAFVGAAGFTLTVTGGGFSRTAFVQWNGTNLVTSFVSASQLSAAVPASLLTTPSTAVPVHVVSGGITSNVLPFRVDIPPPVITSLNPAGATAGGPGLTVVVTGTGFNATSGVNWAGSRLATTYVNGTQLSATVPANLITTPGSIPVTVVNGAITSNAVNFVVAPRPVISSVTPVAATAGGPSFTLTVNGSGFAAGTTVRWNGTSLNTTVVNATQVTAAAPANLLVTEGTAAITVVVGGSVSNAVDFQIRARLVLTSLSSASVGAGAASFTLTVNGTGFLPGAVVLWNGTALPTTVVSSTRLLATVGANLIANPGTVSITVSSNATTSNPITFLITTRPTITTASQLPMAAIGVAYQRALAASGGSGSEYRWTGAGLPSWLTLSPGGVLTGVPPAGASAVTFTVTVTDSLGGTATATFVLPVGNALTIIAPNTLPNGVPESTYLYSFRASGGSGGSGAGYTWSSAGTPAWLTLSPTGLLRGIPPANAAGTYTITVSVTDVGGSMVSGRYTLTIVAAPTPSLTAVLPSTASVGGLPFTIAITGSNFAPTAQVQWNGSPLPTTFTDSSRLSANVSATLLEKAGSANVTVSSLNVVSNALKVNIAGPAPAGLNLSQTGFTFQVVQNGPPPPPRTFRVLSAGAPLSYSVSVSTLGAGPAWLSATPLAGNTDSAPTVTVQVNPSGLEPGEYYGQLRISSSGASNPQLVSVVLIVSAPAVTLGPVIDPVGLLFVGTVGGPAPPSRSITIHNPNATDIRFTSSAVFPDAARWFTYEPAEGSVPRGGQFTVNVRPTVAGLAAAVYQAQLQFQFADGTRRLVTLVLVVAPGAQTGGSRVVSTRANGTCSPSQLIPVIVLLSSGEGFQVPAGGPAPIAVIVVDDCGVPLEPSGSVTASFSNGDPSLPLRSQGVVGGEDFLSARWTGTWPVRNTRVETMTVTITAENAPLTLKGITYLGGTVSDNLNAPIILDGAIKGSAANNAGPAPGSLVSIYGTRLAEAVTMGDAVPRPLDLQGTSVVLGDAALPLLYSAPDQINAIIPFGISADLTHSLVVRRGKRQSAVQTVSIRESQPAIFTTDSTGKGQGHIYLALRGNALAGPATPAVAGDILVIYCAGLGNVDPPIAAGSAAPLSPFSTTVKTPIVTIGGIPARVEFSGLAPLYTGLYQINAVMPDGVPPGDSVPVVVTVGNEASPPVSMSVR